MLNKGWRVVGAVLLGIICFCFFHVFLQYTLFFKEQMQLFSYSETYLLSYFAKPAWLSLLVGDFLSQFLYFRGGATILALLAVGEWLALSWLIAKESGSRYACWWGMLPVAADMALNANLLYPVAQSVAMLLLVSLFALYSLVCERWARIAFLPLATALGYWLFGGVVLAFPLLALIFDLNRKKLVWSGYALSALFAAVLPAVVRCPYLLTAKQAYLYPVESASALLPVALLCAVAALALVVARFEYAKPWIWRIAIAAFAMAVAAVSVLHFANFNAEKIYSLDCECYFRHDDKVLELARKYDLKNKTASYFVNIALARKGQMPDSMLNYYQPFFESLMLPVSPKESWQSILFSNEAYYLVGDMNMAQHSAMLGMTFSPHLRSARLVKRLAEINMVNGDYPAAMKYLRLLERTWCYRTWATRRIDAIAKNAMPLDIQAKRLQVFAADTIRNVNAHAASLEALVRSCPSNTAAIDYLLCYHLLNKDIDMFAKLYNLYGIKVSRPVPSMYAEALLIWLYRNKGTRDDIIKYRVPVNKIADFVRYNKANEGSLYSENEFVKKFGKTYWFYFQFATQAR